MERVERLLRGKVIPTPLWYDAMKAHPPAERYTRTSKPRMMEFPEDRLKRVWLRRNPAATLHPKVLFQEESSFSPSELEHPADGFVRRQMELMRKGMGEEEAYRKVLEEQKQETVGSPEAIDAMRAARSFGATQGGETAEVRGGAARGVAPGVLHVVPLPPPPPPAPFVTHQACPLPSQASSGGGVKQALLREFAEDARAAGLPYPTHWFDKEGNWIGITGSGPPPPTPPRPDGDLARDMRGLDLGKPRDPK